MYEFINFSDFSENDVFVKTKSFFINIIICAKYGLFLSWHKIDNEKADCIIKPGCKTCKCVIVYINVLFLKKEFCGIMLSHKGFLVGIERQTFVIEHERYLTTLAFLYSRGSFSLENTLKRE